MKFAEHLASLRKGTRNSELVALMLRGLGERMYPQEVVDAIHAANPDMTDAELRHAMQTAEGLKTDRAPSVGELRIAAAVRYASAVDREDMEFVERTIAAAPDHVSSADIMRTSPLDIADATPREQALAYCATVFPDDRHFVFTATDETIRCKRTRDTLRLPSEIFREIADGGPIPSYAIANQFTGLGSDSFACTSTLATRRLALLEFDDLPISDQLRFWSSAIENGTFGDRLRTLVYSGTKSIHALIRVDSVEMTGIRQLDGGVWEGIYHDDPVAVWKMKRTALSNITEHAENPLYRADKACKDPTRLTRFAGALRARKDGLKRIQRLLWCAKPTDFDIPIYGWESKTYYSQGYGLNGEYYSNDNHAE